MVRHLSVRENRNCGIEQRMTVDYLSVVIFCFTDMLYKSHLASTVCTILDWYVVNVAGMWILHPVCSIHLAHRVIEFAGIEAH